MLRGIRTPAYIRPMSNLTEEQKEAWHKDPANWRLGIFYYNQRSIQLMLGIIIVILSIFRLVEYFGQE